jgi:hypothetical protein
MRRCKGRWNIVGFERPTSGDIRVMPTIFSMSTFIAAADQIDYWIRRHLVEYWDETHPSQLKLNPGRDKCVGLSALGQSRKDQYGALATPIAPHLAALVKQLETQQQA